MKQVQLRAVDRVLEMANESLWAARKKAKLRPGVAERAPGINKVTKLMREGSQYVMASLAEGRKKKDDKTYVNSSSLAPALAAMEINVLLQAALTGRTCFFVNVILFFVMGAMVLVKEEHYSIKEVLLILFQQASSIGYGSNCPGTDEDSGRYYTDHQARVFKMFHALHAWFGNLMVWGELQGSWRASTEWFTRTLLQMGLPHRVVGVLDAVGTALMWAGVYELDQEYTSHNGTKQETFSAALYMTLMTMSTVGYGDIAPASTWGQILSPLYTLWGTSSYDHMTEVVAGGYADVKGWNITNQMKTWWERCWESNRDVVLQLSGPKTGVGPTKADNTKCIKLVKEELSDFDIDAEEVHEEGEVKYTVVRIRSVPHGNLDDVCNKIGGKDEFSVQDAREHLKVDNNKVCGNLQQVWVDDMFSVTTHPRVEETLHHEAHALHETLPHAAHATHVNTHAHHGGNHHIDVPAPHEHHVETHHTDVPAPHGYHGGGVLGAASSFPPIDIHRPHNGGYPGYH